MYFITYHIFYSKTSSDQLSGIFSRFDTTDKSCQDMAVWLRLSILNKVFSRGCGWIPYKTGIRKIHSVMKENKGRDFPKDSLFAVYNYHPLYFYDKVNENNLSFFDQEYMLYLIYNGQPTVRSEDIDHIHPYSLLKKAGVDESRINNIANYQLLDSGTNRGIKNCKELVDWIQNCVDNSIQKGYLERHLIPRDKSLWKTENYDQFYVERSKLIAAKLNIYL